MRLAQRLAAAVDACRTGERVVVAVDGPDAAGKTTLADDVAALLRRPAVRVSVDAWLQPREVRLRRGDESPEGYYLDSFALPALLQTCLLPFRQGAPRVGTARALDVPGRDLAVPAGAALLLDGVFLQRPELRDVLDLVVHLHVTEPVTLRRAVRRDLSLFGSEDAVRRRYERRYLPGQALYRELVDPATRADVLVDNTEPAAPVVLRWPEGRWSGSASP